MKSATKAGLAFAGLIGAYALWPKKKRYGRSGSHGLVTKKVKYAADGESFFKLRGGSRIFVRYDKTSPWRYVGIPTDTVTLLEDAPAGTVGFTLAEDLPSGGIAQVYVQALAEDNSVLGQHKITVQGP